MPVELDVQRTSERAEMWALHMALSRLSGPAVIHSDILGIVQALRSGEGTCVGTEHKDFRMKRGNTSMRPSICKEELIAVDVQSSGTRSVRDTPRNVLALDCNICSTRKTKIRETQLRYLEQGKKTCSLMDKFNEGSLVKVNEKKKMMS